MKEKEIRDKACKWLEDEHGAICLKLELLRRKGFPDVLVLLPDQVMWFIEFKLPGNTPTKIQSKTHDQLIDLGFVVDVLHSVDEVRRTFDQRFGWRQ